MFEVSFPELVILAVIALLVLGPNRLPQAARFAGLWVRRFRAQWHAVKSEFERELAADMLKQQLADTQAALKAAETSLREAAAEAAAPPAPPAQEAATGSPPTPPAEPRP